MPDGGAGDPQLGDGFTNVDVQPDASFMIRTMDATATWPATRRLRAWERDRSAPGPGDHLLDVGCGLGEVVTAMAADVQPDGRAVATDLSEVFLAEGARRAAAAAVDVEFRLGDALALDFDDESFDICRSERMLQWVTDMSAAVGEMVRVLRPRGRLCLIDTDWRTLTVDFGEYELLAEVVAGLQRQRGPAAAAGGHLLNLVRDHGLTDIDCTAATHVWTEWDLQNEDGRSGFFPFASVFGQLVELGHLDATSADRFVAAGLRAAEDRRFYMAVSMVAVFGRRGPGTETA